MIHVVRSSFSAVAAVALLLVSVLPTSTAAQELPPPQPVELECATNASAQILSSASVNDDTQSLVLVRVILGPDGGSLGAHNHPGTLAVVIESGSFGFTHLDEGDMVITRAATEDADSTEEEVPHGEEIILEPGDSFIDSSRVHSATNLADEGSTTVLLAGLVEAGQPLTACADPATPAA